MYLWYKIVNKELLELCAVLINLCSSLRDIWGRVLVMVALGKRECWMQLGISCLEELVPHFYCSIMFEQPWWLGAFEGWSRANRGGQMVIHSLYSGFPKAVTMLGKLEQRELCRTIFPIVVWSWTMPLQRVQLGSLGLGSVQGGGFSK